MNYSYTGSLLKANPSFDSAQGASNKRVVNCDCLLTSEEAATELNSTLRVVSEKRLDGLLLNVQLNERCFRFPRTEVEICKKRKSILPELDYDIDVELTTNEYLSPREIAGILKVTQRSVNRYYDSKKLECLKLTDKVFLTSKNSFKSFLKGCIVEGMKSVEREMI